jgi:hypothetical protein
MQSRNRCMLNKYRTVYNVQIMIVKLHIIIIILLAASILLFWLTPRL